MFAKSFIVELLIAFFVIGLRDTFGLTPEEQATIINYEVQLAIAKSYKRECTTRIRYKPIKFAHVRAMCCEDNTLNVTSV